MVGRQYSIESPASALCRIGHSASARNFRLAPIPAEPAEATRALAINPKLSESLYIRALAKRKLNAPDADADITAAKAIDPRVAEKYARRGLTPQG
jgi:hypothetical protein